MEKKHPDKLWAVWLALMTVLVFSPALFCGYVAFDDPVYVSENPQILSGLSLQNIAWAFREHCGFFSPLLWISYMADASLLAPAPWAFHLTNVLLHSLNAGLLFLFLRRGSNRPALSLTVAALWALHPLRVESVAWVTERKDVLSAFFMFCSLHAYIFFIRRRGLCYAAVLLFMTAGLLVKPVLVTLPVLMLLLDYWPLNRFSSGWRPLVFEKIPLFACSGIFTVTGWLAHRGAISSFEAYSLADRAGIALHNYVFYLWKFFMPSGLAAPYPMTVPSLSAAAGALLLLCGITLAAFYLFRRAPWFFTGWLWFGISLVPVCGFVQIGNTTTADRFTYLPSIGLTVALVWMVAVWKGFRFGKEIAIIAVAGLILLTVRQIAFWRGSDALFSRALAVAPDNPVAQAHYGGWLVSQGRLDEAEPQLLQAVARLPAYSAAVNNLGLLFTYRGDLERALICFEAACANPRHTRQAEINLENCRLLISKQKEL